MRRSSCGTAASSPLDNVLWGGEVADPANQDRDTVALRRVNELIRDDERVTPVLLASRRRDDAGPQALRVTGAGSAGGWGAREAHLLKRLTLPRTSACRRP